MTSYNENEFINAIIIINNPSSKREERDIAQNFILKRAENDYSNFALFLSNQILINSNNKTIEKFIISLLNNMILGKYILSKDWYSHINLQDRINIKKNLFCALGLDISLIIQIASCIASICSKEFPNKENFDFFQNLLVIASDKSQQDNTRLSASIAIRMIIDDVSHDDISDFMGNIANIIYENFNSERFELKKEASNLLFISIKGFLNIIKNDSGRKSVFELIFNFIKFPNKEIKIFGLKALSECASFFYEFLNDQIESIYNLLSDIIENSNDPEMKIQAFEFWIQIASNEKKILKYNLQNNQNYISLHLQDFLFKFCLNTLLITTKNEFEETDNNLLPSKSVILLLEKISGCCNSSYIDNCLKHISFLFDKKNEGFNLYIALLIFNSLLKSHMKEKLFNIIKDLIFQIFEYILNNSVLVTRLIGEIYLSVCENYFGMFDDDNKLKILDSLFNFINILTDKLTLTKLIYSIHFCYKYFDLKKYSSKLFKNNKIYFIIRIQS